MKLISLFLFVFLPPLQCPNHIEDVRYSYREQNNSQLQKGDFWYFAVATGQNSVFFLEMEETSIVFEYEPDKMINLQAQDAIPLIKFMVIHNGSQYQPAEGYVVEKKLMKEKSTATPTKTFDIDLKANFVDGDSRESSIRIRKTGLFERSE